MPSMSPVEREQLLKGAKKIRASDLLDCIPTRQPLSVQAKPVYLIFGKPGVGSTTLSRKLATHVSAELVDPSSVIEQSLTTQSHPFHLQVKTALCSPPGEIETSLVVDLILEKIRSRKSLSQGFVLDCLAYQDDKRVQELYAELLEGSAYNFPVVVSLDISDEDLLIKRLNQRVDYATMRVYTRSQVLYSMTQQALASYQTDTSGEKEESALDDEATADCDGHRETYGAFGEDRPTDQSDEHYEIDLDSGYISDEEAPDLPPLLLDTEVGELKDAEATEAEIKQMIRMQRLERHQASRKLEFSLGEWEPVSADVLSRLVSRSEDTKASVLGEVSAHNSYSQLFLKFAAVPRHKPQFVALDGTQHPTILFKNLKEVLRSRGYAIFYRNVLPVRLPALAANDSLITKPKGHALEQTEAVKYFAKVGLEAYMPRRDVGHFSRFCPVTWYYETRLEPGLAKFVVSYKHLIYFFATEAKLQEFCDFPEFFLCSKPSVPSLKVAIIGGPFSGRTTQADLLTEYFDLGYVSLTDTLRAWDRHPNQKELLKLNPNYSKIVKRLKMGKPLTTDMSIDVIKMCLKDEAWLKEHPNGWVLDGFPNTVDEAAALVAAGIVPDYVCHIICESKDTNNMEKRKKLVQTSSKTGLPLSDEVASTQERVDLITDILEPVDRSTKCDVESARLQPEELTSLQLSEQGLDFPIVAYPAYSKMLEDYRAEAEEISKCFEEADVTVFQIQSSQSVVSMFVHTMYHIHPFSIRPEVLAADQILPAYSISEDAGTNSASLDLGLAKDYCLHSLMQGNLVKGNRQIAVRYNRKSYFFSSEDARLAFLLEPFMYIRDNKLQNVPPPHISVIGPSGCGKSTIFSKLELHGTPVVCYDDLAKILENAALDASSRAELELACRSRDSSLSSNATVAVFQALQSREPYKTRGYIIEGFPRTRTEMEACYRSQYHFEVVINFQADSNSSAKRKWTAEAKNPNSEVSMLIESKNEDDIQAKKEALVEQCDRDTALISDAVAALERISSTPVFTVNADRCERPIIAEVQAILKSLLGDDRAALLETALPLASEDLDEGLKLGIWEYSQFAHYDPVSMRKRAKKGQYLGAAAIGRHPVIFRDKVFFFVNSKFRNQFVSAPVQYINGAKIDIQSLVNPEIAVVGLAASGQTSLSLKLAKEFRLTYVTVAIAVNNILSAAEDLAIKSELRECLAKGEAIQDVLAAKAVSFFVKRFDCQTRGWILDGWPIKKEQFQLLEATNQSPKLTLCLNASEAKRGSNAACQVFKDVKQKQNRAHHPIWANYRAASVQSLLESLCEYLDNDLNSLLPLDANVSEWKLFADAEKLVCGSLEDRRSYMESLMDNKPASVAKSGLRKDEMLTRLGRFGLFCPVSLVLHGQLVRAESKLSNPLITEYQEKLYGFADEKSKQIFVDNPDYFLSSSVQLPEHIPIAVENTGQELSFGGFCPATYVDGDSKYAALIRPPATFRQLVCYRNRFYAARNAEALEKILRLPEKYLGTGEMGPVLPKRIPPPVEEKLVAGLPTEQYLEVVIQKLVNEALLSLGKLKPKYPYLSLEKSASLFVGLYLKAHDDKLKDYIRTAYQKKLEDFVTQCDSIKSLMRKMKLLDEPLKAHLGSEVPLPSIGSVVQAKTVSLDNATNSTTLTPLPRLNNPFPKAKAKLPPIPAIEEQKKTLDAQLDEFQQLKFRTGI